MALPFASQRVFAGVHTVAAARCELAAAFTELGPVRGVGFAELGGAPFDLIVNATSASLAGDLPPFPPAVIGPQTVCYDLA